MTKACGLFSASIVRMEADWHRLSTTFVIIYCIKGKVTKRKVGVGSDNICRFRLESRHRPAKSWYKWPWREAELFKKQTTTIRCPAEGKWRETPRSARWYSFFWLPLALIKLAFIHSSVSVTGTNYGLGEINCRVSSSVVFPSVCSWIVPQLCQIKQ